MATKEIKRKPRKFIQSQSRAMVAKVFHFLQEEYQFTNLYKEPNCDISHLRNIGQRTADATGTSVRSVQKILQEERELSSGAAFPSPMRHRQRKTGKISVDHRLAHAVRTSVRECYVLDKRLPELSKLRITLKNKIGYDACRSTIRKLLIKLGYTWNKGEAGKRAIVERHDIQMARLRYLKKISEYRSQGRPVVYADESFVYATNLKCHTYSRRSARYIVAHAGTKDGFINNARLVHRTKQGDDNAKMDFEYYQKWLDENLLPNLPEKAVIVLDATSFSNVQVEALPTMHESKSQMEAWLTSNGIHFDENLRQIELYDIIRQHKVAMTTYKVDNYIKSKGFEVLRLPQHHPELNAIVHIWESLKSQMKTVEYDIEQTEKVIKFCFDKITAETWRNACSSVMEKEIEYLEHFDTGFTYVTRIEDECEGETESETDDENSDDEEDGVKDIAEESV